MADDDEGILKAIAETKQQLVDDATKLHRAAAIAARQGYQLEHRQQHGTDKQSAVQASPEQQPKKHNSSAMAPKGIPMSLIMRIETDEGNGNALKFVPGELQVEEAKQEAAETRLPTLPHLPAIQGYMPGVDNISHQLGTSEPGMIGTSMDEQAHALRTASILEENAGFYVKCLPFLPSATPEQHFEVFGISQPLNKDEWYAFIKRERN